MKNLIIILKKHIPISRTSLLLLSLLHLLLINACDLANTAEGYYVEKQNSGRYVNADSNNNIRSFYRMALHQFDNNVGGVIESFELPIYSIFEQQPDIITSPRDYYFCTRIENSYAKHNTYYIQFVDKMNRNWVLTAKKVGNDLETFIRRINAKGELIDETNELPECPALDPYNNYYVSKNLDLNKQIVLKQENKNVTSQKLKCINYFKKTEVNTLIPVEMPHCNNYRMALILTKIIPGSYTGPDNSKSTLILNELETYTLDAYDMNNSYRKILLRQQPELLIEPDAQIASATLIIYEDTPPYNNKWDNLHPLQQKTEKVIAYLPNTILLFNKSKPLETLNLLPYDKNQTVTQITREQWPENVGWNVYTYTSEESAVEHNMKINWIKTIKHDPANTVQLLPIPVNCRTCYTNKDDRDCKTCPPLIPVLPL